MSETPSSPSEPAPWSSSGQGTAVSSGQTSAYALKALRPDGTAGSGPHPRPADPLADLARLDGDNAAPKADDPSLVGSISGFFKRLLGGEAKERAKEKAKDDTVTRTGLKVVIDPRPSTGVISLQRPERVIGPDGEPDLELARARADAVRAQAQRLAAQQQEGNDPPTAGGARDRIVEKQRAMQELKRQREQEARAQAEREPAPTVFRRPVDGAPAAEDHPPGA